MRLSLVLISMFFMYGAVHAVTLCDGFRQKNISLEELAPQLRIALSHNDRNEAIRAAVAVRDFVALDTIIFSPEREDNSSVDAKLLLALVTAIEHGCNLMTLPPAFRIPYTQRPGLFDEPFWLAIKNGRFDLAMSIVTSTAPQWSPLKSFMQKRVVDLEVVKNFVSIFPQIIDYALERIESDSLPLKAKDVVRRQFELFYEPMLRRVANHAMRAELKKLLVTAYILVVGSEIFSRNMRPDHLLKAEAQARIVQWLGYVSEQVRVRDLMGIICEYVDLENSRWLLSEFAE